MHGRSEGSMELLVALFRLAVADFLGHSYSHDGCGAIRSITSRHRTDASAFLSGPWAAYLADVIGLDGAAIWREARRLDAT